MLTVTRAYTQRGWSSTDHLIDDTRMDALVGRAYFSLGDLRRAARAACDEHGFPTVEYHDGLRRYRYDGSPDGIPGRQVNHIKDLGRVDQVEGGGWVG